MPLSAVDNIASMSSTQLSAVDSIAISYQCRYISAVDNIVN